MARRIIVHGAGDVPGDCPLRRDSAQSAGKATGGCCLVGTSRSKFEGRLTRDFRTISARQHSAMGARSSPHGTPLMRCARRRRRARTRLRRHRTRARTRKAARSCIAAWVGRQRLTREPRSQDDLHTRTRPMREISEPVRIFFTFALSERERATIAVRAFPIGLGTPASGLKRASSPRGGQARRWRAVA